MRSLITLASVALLSACASQTPAPATAAAPAPAAKKSPQCWNAETSAFQDIGTKTTLSSVAVECKPTTDGKSAQWTPEKAKH